MAEVISLELSSDSDDDICEITPASKKKMKAFKCLNPECRTTRNLVKAQEKIRQYYGVTAHKKKTRICGKCKAKVILHKDKLVSHIRRGLNVMDQKLLLHTNTMVLTDSESDKTDDEEWEDNSDLEYDLGELSKKPIDNSKSDIEVLKNVITDVIADLQLNQQIKDGKESICESLSKAEKKFQELDEDYNSFENEIDCLRKKFYEAFTCDIKWLPPLLIGPPDAGNDLCEITEVISELPKLYHTQLPPVGPIHRPQLMPAEKVYFMKSSSFAPWMQAIVSTIDKEEENETTYLIQYSKSKEQYHSVFGQKIVSGKKLAYFYECPTRVEVGSRIIAKFHEEDLTVQQNGSWYVGIVAEIPNATNKYRYLIFFDDGYAQYVEHCDLRVVTQSSHPSWDDVASESKEFIKDYLQTYPERPLVRLVMNNIIKTELNGKWYNAHVLEVDGSLAKMRFPNENRTEWIYRGSTRLSPLFNKKMNSQLQAEQMKTSRHFVRRRTAPVNRSGLVVEYINFQKVEDPEDENENEDENEEASKPSEKRAVAKKSTSSKANTGMSVALVHMKENLVLECKGHFTYLQITGISTKFTPHQCNPNCLGIDCAVNNVNPSPLFTPISFGWRRHLVKQKKKTFVKMFIIYVAPCGRRLRSLDEIFRFLRLTKSRLEIDFFTFDQEVILEREWWPSRQLFHLPDITEGKEDVHISCVNSIESTKPKTLIYSNVRIPCKNVGINLDPNFLVCCSCEDDCQDKTVCECWQLTIEANGRRKSANSDAGYKHRRLHEQVIAGLYECNSQCQCKRSCLNKVIQFPIRQKLQLFKTARRGWGVRTLNDLPLGTFICVYVGRLLTETEANEEGMSDGADDYYAELDLIETTEARKEGYESDVSDIEDDEDFVEKEEDHTSGYKTHYSQFEASELPTLGRERSSRLLAKKLNSKSESDESEDSDDSDFTGRRRQTFEPINTSKKSMLHKSPKKLRQLFGNNEDVFIMDAKVTGNIGRYLNHSCNPNVFVQNVFVDTHDPRFPSIAFFAGSTIKAGTELTWDYSYEVDSVPGKIKYCYCQSPNCRGRLL